MVWWPAAVKWFVLVLHNEFCCCYESQCEYLMCGIAVCDPCKRLRPAGWAPLLWSILCLLVTSFSCFSAGFRLTIPIPAALVLFLCWFTYAACFHLPPKIMSWSLFSVASISNRRTLEGKMADTNSTCSKSPDLMLPQGPPTSLTS